MIKKVTEADFQEIVIQSEKPVVVDFNAAWCGPCKKLSPILEQLAQEFESKTTFVEVDAGTDPGVAQKYGVMSLPTVLIFKDGAPKERIIGLTSKDKISRKIQSVL